MKLEISGGVLKYTIESTDGNLTGNEIVSVINNASLSNIKFIEKYYDYYAECKDHKEAYERIEKLHETLFGKRKYSDYDSFRVNKSKFMNK